MKKFLKILLWSIASIVVLLGLLMTGFMYKVNNGFPVSYETEAPVIDFPAGKRTVLLFSKATGFRHGESIEAGKIVFDELAKKNTWFLYSTEEGGAFNPQQLAKFDVVIFSNSTGRVLNDEQQKALGDYVEQGGSLIGIHGSGDGSHHWDWYEQKFLGAKFSHHPLHPQFQKAEVTLDAAPDSYRDKVYQQRGHTLMNGISFSITLAVTGSTSYTPLTGKRLFRMGISFLLKPRILAWAKIIRWHGVTP